SRRSPGSSSSAPTAASGRSSRGRSRCRSSPPPCADFHRLRLVGARTQRARRGLEVTRVARRSGLRRVLREVGVAGERPATREGAVEFRLGLEELGTTYVKLGQLLSSRPDLLPDVYIDELSKLVDDAPPVPFEQIEET